MSFREFLAKFFREYRIIYTVDVWWDADRSDGDIAIEERIKNLKDTYILARVKYSEWTSQLTTLEKGSTAWLSARESAEQYRGLAVKTYRYLERYLKCDKRYVEATVLQIECEVEAQHKQAGLLLAPMRREAELKKLPQPSL